MANKKAIKKSRSHSKTKHRAQVDSAYTQKQSAFDRLLTPLAQVNQTLANRKKLPVWALQKAATRAFRQVGFLMEYRQAGDLRLGLLRRRSLKNKGQIKRVQPRRLVFHPGFGDSPISWFPVLIQLIPFLDRQFDEVILIDLPGYMGFLSNDRSFESMDELKQIVFDTLDSLKPDVIIGHSLGAWVVADYSVQCGEKKRPLQSSGKYQGPSKIILANPSGILADEFKREEWYERFFEIRTHGSRGGFRKHLFKSEPLWFRFIADSFLSFVEKPDVQKFVDSVHEDDLINGKLKHIRAKTWLLWGENDSLVPSHWVEDWLGELNNDAIGKDEVDAYCDRGMAHAIIVKRAGHSPHLEKPLVTAFVIEKILKDENFQSMVRSNLPALKRLRGWEFVQGRKRT